MIEFPKTINKKRVLKRAWSWYNGNGTYRIPKFSDALKESWDHEKLLIKSEGAIYHPYIMMH